MKNIVKKSKIGIIVKKSAAKTAVVLVRRQKKHPKYLKRFWVEKKYLVHDEKDVFQVGQKVKIEETKPISKRKSWQIIEAVSPEASRVKKDLR